jgi:hypothetical protein
MIGESDLPAGLHRKIAYSHPERRTPGTRRDTLVGSEVLVAGTRAAGELDDEALAHEVGTICESVRRTVPEGVRCYVTYGKLCSRLGRIQCEVLKSKLTRNNVTRVHRVLVLDEAEAVHELDLSDLASAMGLEVGLDICLGGIAGEVAQVEARTRYLGHGDGSYDRLCPNDDLVWRDS